MPIAIAGMHRSGTSLITRLLHLCGLDLGADDQLVKPAPDNPEGFWESVPFVSLNQDLMEHLGGGWHAPPDLPNGWERAPAIDPWRERAARLPKELNLREPWGWKDPRNSITLPFWRSVWPELQVVICVRHPLEVACSLLHRNRFELVRGLRLWLDYHRRIVDELPVERRVVTHYESYFTSPSAELHRLCDRLGIAATDATLESACSAIAPNLRHSEFAAEALATFEEFAPVRELYQQMMDEATFKEPAHERRSTLGAVAREALRLDLLERKQQARLQELEAQVLALAADLDRTQHQLNLSREFGRERDKQARLLQQRMDTARHRYADKVADVLLRIADPLGRRRMERTIDELLGDVPVK